jgi:hypothetical protein
MSRSQYCDDLDNWAFIRWRGAVRAGINGKRGQLLIKELAQGLDAMPVKALIEGQLEDADGAHCALGVVGALRGIDMSGMQLEDEWGGVEMEPEDLGAIFNIPSSLAQEIMYMNDEAGWHNDTPEQRWTRMRSWTAEHIINE